MKINSFLKITIAFLSLVPLANYSASTSCMIRIDSAVIPKKAIPPFDTENAPTITATGNQNYCPGTSVNIVIDVTITGSDANDTGTEAMYIQISAGYVSGQDLIKLANPALHPNIKQEWRTTEGKLKLSSAVPGTELFYTDFENAIKDVVFSNSSATPSGTREFSITIGEANYLPRNGHYYEFIPSTAITWTAAKAAAESKNYYGLQGYLATITSMDEVQITGEQATGSGWIGGSDEAVDDVWRWMTGPEKGTIFWNGKANGTSPNFSYWNKDEPNDYGSIGEKYAHITAPGVGIKGSWNDMTVTGDNSGATVNGVTAAYQAKGYAIEYGGTVGDPILQISASTTITIPEITTSLPASSCGSGQVTLQATSSGGTVNWYDTASNGTLLYTGNSYTTPTLDTTTTYYVTAGCLTNRTPIIATIYAIPTITATNSPASRCGTGTVTLEATTSQGTVNWYQNRTDVTALAIGTFLTLSNITQNTTYYAEAINNGCTNGDRTAVEILIYAPPVVIDQELKLCKAGSLTLDAQIPNMTYLWSTSETTQTILITSPGSYNVDITNSTNCSSTKNITVIEPDTPEIDRIDLNETTAVIYLKNQKDYFEYSIDRINYQNSNVFYSLANGLQTAYVRDVNSCYIVSKNFIVLLIPKFFTPNDDSYNDVWEIKTLLINYPDAEVSIFDRYGKLITKLNIAKPAWDGTFNKNLLPASDYWYVLKIDANSPEKSGHFSLKR